MIKATFGNLAIHKRWDWNVSAGYKYLETDSTLDSINDADFHLGGTNAEGTILTGSLGVAKDDVRVAALVQCADHFGPA